MDNIELITLLSDYAIFCLDRQETMLKVYRKRQRSLWQVSIDAFIVTMALAGIIAAIWCAAIDYIDGWLAVLLTVLYGIAQIMGYHDGRNFFLLNNFPGELHHNLGSFGIQCRCVLIQN